MNPPAEANHLWARLIVEELVRSGVNFFCISPGSRSTPLVAALSENPKAKPLVHFDERGTAFAALGYARATGRAAAWITTSGTAVANGLPAIVEASTDSVPMILLTADRPPELRQTGANQTIVQPNIFGDYTRWSFDLPAPDLSVDPASVLTTVDQAVYRARNAPKGPVHLNLMFREPFLGKPEDEGENTGEPGLWRESGRPYTRYTASGPALSQEEVKEIRDELSGVRRGLVVAGRLGSREQGEAVLRVAEGLGWPVLPDVSSQIRLGKNSEMFAPYYDALLSDKKFRESHAPEAVLHFGGRALSKRLEQFVGGARPDPYVVVREHPFRLDPGHRVTHSVQAGIEGFCEAFMQVDGSGPGADPSSWKQRWTQASRVLEKRVDQLLNETESLNEPLVARIVSRHIPEEHGLVLASSMPIRDMDTFAAVDGPPVPVAANRGASGIDGTVATAAGFAWGSGKPVTLLVGDLALLHDLNSLAMLRGLPVVVVAVNNDGGGIFSFLPVAQHGKFFEPYFGTPHGLAFESAAAMFGIRYEKSSSTNEFVNAYRSACRSQTPTLIEVKTDREENVALHRRFLEESTADLPL